MTEKTSPLGKEAIMSALNKLVQETHHQELKVETKEEAVEKEKNKALLVKVADYTVNNIVNGMATLQLDFSNLTQEISQRLDTESNILNELKRAIAVENEKLAQLKKIRLVADGLYILRQEQEEKIKLLENQIQETQSKINEQQEKLRKEWLKEATDFEARITEEASLLREKREKEEADYQYNIEQQRRRERDEYEETRRNQERELRLINEEKNKVWLERENILARQEEEFNLNEEKIAGFEAKIQEEVNKARGEAIREADREAQIKANLIEKQWEADKQGFEFKIQSLEAKIQSQNQEIEAIIAQLQNATNQAQNLALRAFQPTNS